jgi:hypothetical protein
MSILAKHFFFAFMFNSLNTKICRKLYLNRLLKLQLLFFDNSFLEKKELIILKNFLESSWILSKKTFFLTFNKTRRHFEKNI